MRRTTLPDTAFERADNFLSNECIHTRFSFQIASSQGANQKSSGFCVFRFRRTRKYDLSSLYRILGSNLCMHVTAHVNISSEIKNQKRNNLNCGRIIAGLPKLHQVPAGCLAIRQQSALYRDHVCLRYLKSEAWPSKSRDITWTSSSGESWRDWCAVKIPRYRQPEGAYEALLGPISQHRVAKAIQAFTMRLKGCIARRGGRFELRPK